MSELLPATAKIADDICIVKSMHTEAINHDPAVTFIQTGAQIAGRPSIGAWLAYGLGSESSDLPAFVVMVTQGGGGQPLYDRLWGSGFLPTQYQGVKFRSVGDPVLYLSNPKGFSKAKPPDLPRRPRQAQPDETRRVRRPGDLDADRAVRDGVSDAKFRAKANGLVGRAGERLQALRRRRQGARNVRGQLFAGAAPWPRGGVRFIQLFHRGWDQHGKLPARASPSRRRKPTRPRRPSSKTSKTVACSMTRS